LYFFPLLRSSLSNLGMLRSDLSFGKKLKLWAKWERSGLKKEYFSLQYKYEIIVIRRVCHLSGDTESLLGFVWIVFILNSMFRGNAMDCRETAVEELKVLCFVVKPVVISSNGRKLNTCTLWKDNWLSKHLDDSRFANRFFSNNIAQLSACVDFYDKGREMTQSTYFYTGIFEEISIKYIIQCWINFPSKVSRASQIYQYCIDE